MIELELVDTGLLIDELFRRFEHALFTGAKIEGPSTLETCEYKGHGRMCTELARVAAWKIQKHYEDGQEPNGGHYRGL